MLIEKVLLYYTQFEKENDDSIKSVMNVYYIRYIQIIYANIRRLIYSHTNISEYKNNKILKDIQLLLEDIKNNKKYGLDICCLANEILTAGNNLLYNICIIQLF